MSKYIDGADELAFELFDLVREEKADQDVIDCIAEALRQVARGAVDTKDWNL